MTGSTSEELKDLLKRGQLQQAALLASKQTPDESIIRQLLETALAEYSTAQVGVLIDALLKEDMARLEIETLEAMFEVMRVEKHPRRQEIAVRLGVETAPQLIRPALQKQTMRRMMSLFQGREDIHARQYEDGGGRGGYSPVRQPVNEETLRRHLNGQISVGVYLLNSHNMVQFFAIDMDIRRAVLELTPADTSSLLRRLRDEIIANQHVFLDAGLKPVLEFSGGKGFHLWFFLAEPVPAQMVREYMQKAVIPRLNYDENSFQLELFPKQDRLNRGGLGNLIKIPLGRHKVSGHWSWFLDWQGQPIRDVDTFLMKDVEVLRRQEFLQLAENISGQNQGADFSSVHEILDEDSGSMLTQPVSVMGEIPLARLKPSSDIPLRKMIAGCDTLRTLLKRIETFRVVEPAERHALVYMLTPLGECGIVEIHRILSMTLDYNMNEVKRLVHAVPPHLISCPKVRKRIPAIAANSSCNCQFDLPEGSYPSPLIQAGILPKATGGILEKPALPALPQSQLESLCLQWMEDSAKLLELRGKLDNCEYLLKSELPSVSDTGLIVHGQYSDYEIRLSDEGQWSIRKIVVKNEVEEL